MAIAISSHIIPLTNRSNTGDFSIFYVSHWHTQMPLLQQEQISEPSSAGLPKCSFRKNNVLNSSLLKKSLGFWAVRLDTFRGWITSFTETVKPSHLCTAIIFAEKAPTIGDVYYNYFSWIRCQIQPFQCYKVVFPFLKSSFLNKEKERGKRKRKRKALMGYLLFCSLFRFVNFFFFLSDCQHQGLFVAPCTQDIIKTWND